MKLNNFRNATKSPSPVSPAPPPSIRRRSPSPVCTGNVSRVRSRFESGSSVTSNPSRAAPPSTASSTSSNQTLPKTFKLRETLNPVESRLHHIASSSARFGGSSHHLNEFCNKSRSTGSSKPVVQQPEVSHNRCSPCSPPPPRTKSLFERQNSVPNSVATSQARFMPARQMSQDLIQV